MKILDEGLDELAAVAHQGAPLRFIVTCLSAIIATALLPSWICTGWLAAMSLAELWAYSTTRRQARGETVGPAARASYAVTLFLVAGGWMAFGALLWAQGSPGGAVAGTAIWLSVIFFAQTFAYVSRAGLVIGGALPSLALAAYLAWEPGPLGETRLPILALLSVSLLFAADGVARMMRARKHFDQAQARLQASETQYRMLADHITDVISLSSVDGRRLYLSPSIEAAMGYTTEELYRSGLYTYLHPDDKTWLPAELARLAETGGQATHQYRVQHKDGRTIWVETTFDIVPPSAADPEAKVVSVSRVIDARKALETELVEARRRAEAAAAAKSDFLANMTHELRTPLNAIIGFSGILKDSPNLTPQDSRHAHLIDEASRSLLELVNDVLDFSRLESGQVEVEARPFDPLEPAQALGALLAGQAEARGLSLAVRAEGEIAPLLGDAARIRQVLLNFLSNALKFTERGGVTLTVRQSPLSGQRARLRMEVADTGIGLREDQIEHLFDRFTQADATVSRRYGGTGLGLAICKRTVELMGGRIGAGSKPGEGSTFWFELDLPVTDELPSPTPEPESQVDFARPMRLLLAEDVAVNRELIATLLAPFSLEIETAENGEEAVAAVTRAHFDLVLMDVQMPVMDGLTATRLIRSLPDPAARAVPIVAMTANVLSDQVETCRQAGMDDHLGKPIDPRSLLEVIAHWAGRNRDVPAEEARRSA
ncbi:MAG: ATP-binding protein [Phenylobacterium sp.]|uniref:hybrid sensor histidine kinase/response regulator n=1 Tax=Phenylobacterium sp. TaxID=1871053 RepID=UPI0039194FDC